MFMCLTWRHGEDEWNLAVSSCWNTLGILFFFPWRWAPSQVEGLCLWYASEVLAQGRLREQAASLSSHDNHHGFHCRSLFDQRSVPEGRRQEKRKQEKGIDRKGETKTHTQVALHIKTFSFCIDLLMLPCYSTILHPSLLCLCNSFKSP